MSLPATDLKHDMLHQHWLHVYNWDDFPMDFATDRYNCSAEYVRTVMRDIEKRTRSPRIGTPTRAVSVRNPSSGSASTPARRHLGSGVSRRNPAFRTDTPHLSTV